MSKVIKYNAALTKTYKNAEIITIVEEDLITTAKIFIGGECVNCSDISSDEHKDGLPFNKANYNAVVESMKADVDAMWEENMKALGIVMR